MKALIFSYFLQCSVFLGLGYAGENQPVPLEVSRIQKEITLEDVKLAAQAAALEAVKNAIAEGALTQTATNGNLEEPGHNASERKASSALGSIRSSFSSAWQETLRELSTHRLSWSFLIVILALIFCSALLRIVASSCSKKCEQENCKNKFFLHTLIVLEKPISSFLFLSGLYLIVTRFPMRESTEHVVNVAYKSGSLVLMIWGLASLVSVLVDHFSGFMYKKDIATASFLPLIKRALRTLIIIVGSLMVIKSFGYDVTGIIATLGIGGAAFAFASKDTIANMFGSVSILIDRPFKVGDHIEVSGKLNGHVIGVGLRSTRIKTLTSSIISIPNNILANEVVNNWSELERRQVKQIVKLVPTTPSETLEKIVEAIWIMIRSDAEISQDVSVSFTDFEENALSITINYFTKTTDWAQYLEIRQRVNCNIMKIIAEYGSAIAFSAPITYPKNEEGK